MSYNNYDPSAINQWQTSNSSWCSSGNWNVGVTYSGSRRARQFCDQCWGEDSCRVSTAPGEFLLLRQECQPRKRLPPQSLCSDAYDSSPVFPLFSSSYPSFFLVSSSCWPRWLAGLGWWSGAPRGLLSPADCPKWSVELRSPCLETRIPEFNIKIKLFQWDVFTQPAPSQDSIWIESLKYLFIIQKRYFRSPVRCCLLIIIYLYIFSQRRKYHPELLCFSFKLSAKLQKELTPSIKHCIAKSRKVWIF